MPKSYTRTGDDGTTGRFGGQRMSKSAPLIELLGALDETNAAIGLARSFLRPALAQRSDLDSHLRDVQDLLFRIGADLSTPLAHSAPPVPRIVLEDTDALEKKIDALDEQLPELRKFILPGGTQVAATLHMARTISRRAERVFVSAAEQVGQLNPTLKPLINRLSSYLFALARYANHLSKYEEEHPKYNQ